MSDKTSQDIMDKMALTPAQVKILLRWFRMAETLDVSGEQLIDDDYVFVDRLIAHQSALNGEGE